MSGSGPGLADRIQVRAAGLLDPERAHRCAVRALAAGIGPRRAPDRWPRLATDAFGLHFPNPLGLAAGFDKHAEAISGALGLGFGFVEIGGVTPRPQSGNARPRVFRLAEDRAVINRYGFNSEGLDAVTARVAAFRRSPRGASALVGANLGANKDSADPAGDFAAGAAALGALADFVTINVSSPNTPGLRDLQGRARLAETILRTAGALAGLPDRRAALLVKVAPDLDEAGRADVAEVLLDTRLPGREMRAVDALIIGNTTLSRPPSLASRHAVEAGGLSGAPLTALAQSVTADFARLLGGRLPIVGCGGIASGADAYARIRAGASLLQLYTALVFEGSGLVPRLLGELDALLARDGFARVADAVGADIA